MNNYFLDKTLRSVTFIICPPDDDGEKDQQPSAMTTPIVLTQLLSGGFAEFVAMRSDSRKYTTPECVLQILRNTSTSEIVFLCCASTRKTTTAPAAATSVCVKNGSIDSLLSSSSPPSLSLHICDGRYVTGEDVTEALKIGEGICYIDADNSIVAATPQYELTNEAIGNIIATMTMTAFSQFQSTTISSSTATTFAQAKRHAKDVDAARYEAIVHNILQSCPLDKTQMPGRVVPLRFGTLSQSQHHQPQQQQEQQQQQQRLVSRIFSRLSQNVVGFGEFQRLPVTEFGCHEQQLWANNLFHADCAVASFPLIWNQQMCLKTLQPAPSLYFEQQLQSNKKNAEEEDDDVEEERHTNKLSIASTIMNTAAQHQQMLLELFNAAPTIAALGDLNIHTLQQADAYIKSRPLPMFRDGGIGSFAVTIRSSSSSRSSGAKPQPCCIGITGLILRDHFAPLLDLGFGFLPCAHGTGAATEAGKLTLVWAQRVLCQTELKAVTNESNAAAQKLLSRLGFSHTEKEDFHGWEAQQRVYSLRLR